MLLLKLIVYFSFIEFSSPLQMCAEQPHPRSYRLNQLAQYVTKSALTMTLQRQLYVLCASYLEFCTPFLVCNTIYLDDFDY